MNWLTYVFRTIRSGIRGLRGLCLICGGPRGRPFDGMPSLCGFCGKALYFGKMYGATRDRLIQYLEQHHRQSKKDRQSPPRVH